MCGIAGWMGPPAEVGVLQRMTDMVRHRGPNGEGQIILPLTGGNVAALGHRRLSIIDLAGGAQPMASHDGRYTIVFNGEIYNYIEIRDELVSRGARFETRSDTEVILEAWREWGPDALVRFRGMFAFALYDNAERQVVLARDQFGKKPLYIYDGQFGSSRCLVFGSEISALLVHPSVRRELDIDTLFQYLCQRYAPGPFTFFKGITKIPPGSYMVWKNGVIETHRYWTAPEETLANVSEIDDPVGAFREIFDEAVRIRLRADVPVGAFLSSGLDSTAIVASLAHLGAQNIHTFSVGFRNDPKSELPAAAATAKILGTLHKPLEIDSDSLTALLPMLSKHRGAPIAEPADLPIYLMSMEAAKYVKVVLSGEGSDEMFAGYPKHLVERYFGGLPTPGLLSVAGKAMLAATSIFPARSRRLHLAARAMSAKDFDERMVRWFGAITSAERDELWIGPNVSRPAERRPFEAANGTSALRRVLHFDQTSWLPDNLLDRMDVMTMAASIEGRTPFMDVKLAEFAATLPDHWRIGGRVTKRIVRTALSERIPPEVLNRPKNGFRLPVTQWFQQNLREPSRDLLLASDSRSGEYLDRKIVGQILDEHVSGRKNHDKTLWALFALETFMREFF
ncbi:MAG: asparagine synthase (glutamine-hydrolyzing) [Rhizobiaceae bacterium]|nr:asparagine synthase (glutamine-hydrolyzing) [Rhizobiaceae bacterium]